MNKEKFNDNSVLTAEEKKEVFQCLKEVVKKLEAHILASTNKKILKSNSNSNHIDLDLNRIGLIFLLKELKRAQFYRPSNEYRNFLTQNSSVLAEMVAMILISYSKKPSVLFLYIFTSLITKVNGFVVKNKNQNGLNLHPAKKLASLKESPNRKTLLYVNPEEIKSVEQLVPFIQGSGLLTSVFLICDWVIGEIFGGGYPRSQIQRFERQVLKIDAYIRANPESDIAKEYNSTNQSPVTIVILTSALIIQRFSTPFVFNREFFPEKNFVIEFQKMIVEILKKKDFTHLFKNGELESILLSSTDRIIKVVGEKTIDLESAIQSGNKNEISENFNWFISIGIFLFISSIPLLETTEQIEKLSEAIITDIEKKNNVTSTGQLIQYLNDLPPEVLYDFETAKQKGFAFLNELVGKSNTTNISNTYNIILLSILIFLCETVIFDFLDKLKNKLPVSEDLLKGILEEYYQFMNNQNTINRIDILYNIFEYIKTRKGKVKIFELIFILPIILNNLSCIIKSLGLEKNRYFNIIIKIQNSCYRIQLNYILDIQKLLISSDLIQRVLKLKHRNIFSKLKKALTFIRKSKKFNSVNPLDISSGGFQFNHNNIHSQDYLFLEIESFSNYRYLLIEPNVFYLLEFNLTEKQVNQRKLFSKILAFLNSQRLKIRTILNLSLIFHDDIIYQISNFISEAKCLKFSDSRLIEFISKNNLNLDTSFIYEDDIILINSNNYSQFLNQIKATNQDLLKIEKLSKIHDKLSSMTGLYCFYKICEGLLYNQNQIDSYLCIPSSNDDNLISQVTSTDNVVVIENENVNHSRRFILTLPGSQISIKIQTEVPPIYNQLPFITELEEIKSNSSEETNLSESKAQFKKEKARAALERYKAEKLKRKNRVSGMSNILNQNESSDLESEACDSVRTTSETSPIRIRISNN